MTPPTILNKRRPSMFKTIGLGNSVTKSPHSPTDAKKRLRPMINLQSSKRRNMYQTLTFLLTMMLATSFITHQLKTAKAGNGSESILSDMMMALENDECSQMEKIRQNDKVPLDPSTNSIFNCHSVHGKCQYYRPAHFFHPTCGILSKTRTRKLSSSSAAARSSIVTSEDDTSSDGESAYSISSDFNEHLQQMEYLRIEGRLWKNQPPIIIPWVSYMTEMRGRRRKKKKSTFDNTLDGMDDIKGSHMKVKEDERRFQRHNLSFIHVHKAGGTSVVTTMRDLKLYLKENDDKVNISDQINVGEDKNNEHKNWEIEAEKKREQRGIDDYKGMHTMYLGGRSQERSERSWDKADKFLQHAVRYQSESSWETIKVDKKTGAKNEVNHMMMAVVRDPAERFISAVGQVTATKSSKGNAKKLTNQCVGARDKDDRSYVKASEALRCFVNAVKKDGYWIDVHFTPMILEISFATMQKDIPVAIFQFDQLPNILQDLGAPNPHKKRKNGSTAGYRSSALSNATVSDYDDDVLKDVCELYRMDVLFLRDLGKTTHCDVFV